MENFKCAYDKLVDLNKLISNPKNPNKHTEEQIKLLAKIIDFQGQRQPIIVSNRSGFITKGHGRLEALKLLGWEQVAVDYQDYDNEDQEYADMVADNEIARLAEMDIEMVLSEIPNLNIDKEYLGMLEIPQLLNGINYDEEEIMDNDNLKEMNTNKMLALSKMPISSYLVIKFDENMSKEDFIEKYAKKYNPDSDITVKTQFCTWCFMKKDILDDDK